MSKNIVMATLLAVTMFALSFLYQTNDVSGMFVGTKRFGWPTQIGIYKITESRREAEKVRKEKTLTLLNEGWKLDGNEYPKKITFNFAFYILLSVGMIFIVDKMRLNKIGGEK